MSHEKPRARDLGVPFDGAPGPYNAITDVEGVEVGYATLISGDGALRVGVGPVRTGVTAILPGGKESTEPLFAGWFSLNGNGEMTGTTWVEESGFLEGPVMITNTHSVGVVRDGVIAWQLKARRTPGLNAFDDDFWSLRSTSFKRLMEHIPARLKRATLAAEQAWCAASLKVEQAPLHESYPMKREATPWVCSPSAISDAEASFLWPERLSAAKSLMTCPAPLRRVKVMETQAR
jgi:hypothetical protein